MSSTPRYLTKSRFKLALECSTKLYYTGKKDYPDKKLNDEFLKALAKGGFQVGELAKCYFTGGTNINDLDHNIALEKTGALLKLENVIIYEAAFRFKNLFIRADVVVKNGNKLGLYEVKAKSFDPITEKLTTSKGIASNWKPYLYDVAFQKHVILNAFPDFEITSYLTLADKSQLASVDGLNQKFFLETDEKGRTKVKTIGDTNAAALGHPILINVQVDEIIEDLLKEEPFGDNPERSFIEWINFYSDNYEKDQLIQEPLGSQCEKCEFYLTDEEESVGLKSGFKECWRRTAKFKDSDFLIPSTLDIWYFLPKDKYIKEGKYFQHQLVREDLEPKNKSKTNSKPGLNRIDRQEMQITKSKTNDSEPYVDQEGLKNILNGFKYPLHFIDFETSSVAIPFNSGRRPYEQIAFQYSHHIVLEDGTIEHKGQWINPKQGVFPNFEFIRALRQELENDNGTIFKYSNHENSILNAIYRQLKKSSETDKDSLCEWIQSISKSSSGSADTWEGDRNMVDLCELVKSYYYHPATCGSNSIKYVLPALLNSSDFLKSKYSNPIYGTEIKSLNFKDHIWISFDPTGKVINPYKKLEPIFKNIDQDLLDDLVLDEDADLQDGGAAMTAYAQMQFTQMQEKERELIKSALLKYCELDTFAMVMIWEEWNHLIKTIS